MTTPTLALMEYLRKLGLDGDKDFLQESVRVMSQMLMELEVQQKTGAGSITGSITPACTIRIADERS
jgi:hypothetical protein